MKREQAKKLAQFYFRLLADKAGVHWDNDNVTEIDELINCIIDAAKEEIMQSIQHTTNIASMLANGIQPD